MHRSFDGCHPIFNLGQATWFDYLALSPDLWLCCSLSDGPLILHDNWYYGWDGVWFVLQDLAAIWQDAIVLQCSVLD